MQSRRSQFNSQDLINTQGLKISENAKYRLCPANGLARLLHGHKVAVWSQVGDVDIVTPISTSVLKYIHTQIKCIFYALFLSRFYHNKSLLVII